MRRPRVQPAAAGLLAALCTVGVGVGAFNLSGAGAQGTASRARLTGADLVSYANCSQLLQKVKAEALKEVGPYGLPGSSAGFYGPGPVGVARGGVSVVSPLAAGPGTSPASPSAANGGTGPGYSTTNDQEAGVDEPDLVKTDGQVMVILRQQPLGVQVVDVGGGAPRLEGFLPLPQLAQANGLFLVGQDVYVIGAGPSAPLPVGYVGGSVPVPLAASGPKARPAGVPGATVPGPAVVPNIVVSPPLLRWGGDNATTDVDVVSVADPTAPQVVRTFSFQGQDQGARLINGQVVLALTNEPRIIWAYPANATARAEKAAAAANRALVESSKASDWLPSWSMKTTHRSSSATVRRQASCARTYHTAIDAGLGTVSLVSLGPSTNSPGSEVTIVGNAEDVYASAAQVYVATTGWQEQVGPGCPYRAGSACPLAPVYVVPPFWAGARTDIYGFDISNPSSPQYLGSGSVPGTLIGQYAMSAYNGALRVATTVGEPSPAPADGGAPPAQLSDNMVSVLQPDDGSLVTVGALRGLGAGEKIYAVRFVGDLAYVVTFNQTDPLYVVDLSDPGRPVLAGQVSLSGYSSFLQPLGNSLLLGVGEAVDQQLRTEGLQLEIFNVAQPGQPALVSQQQLGSGASSAAEYDPHALLWWPASNLLVLPVNDYSGNAPSSSASVWSVSPAGDLSQRGLIAQPGSSQDGYPQIERAVVVGNDIYTVSEQGLMVSDMSSLTQVAWLPY